MTLYFCKHDSCVTKRSTDSILFMATGAYASVNTSVGMHATNNKDIKTIVINRTNVLLLG